MGRNKFKISFYVQKSRISKNGEVPVMLRITVNKERVVTSTNLRVDPDRWIAAAERIIANTRKDDEVNAQIDTIRARAMQMYRQMELDGDPITAQAIIDRSLGRDTKPAIMLMDLFREHNDNCHRLAGNGMAPATVKRYETSLRHTEAFLRFKFGQNDISVRKVDHKFITDYELFLRSECKCCHNSAVKYLKNFGKIIRIAIANDYLEKDPFANIRFRLEETNPSFLEDHEIEAIMKKEIDIKRLSRVRDIFVFQCFSGLSYSDMKDLKAEHLVRDNDGALWIRKKRQKTGNMCNIPLLDPALKILDRYKDHPVCLQHGVLLPVLSNHKMNVYLAELADICGIKKKISSHVARHSFGTSICLANGVSIDNVAKMLGHSDTKMTRHYARVLDKSIMRDMAVVNGKYAKRATAPTAPEPPRQQQSPAQTSVRYSSRTEIPVFTCSSFSETSPIHTRYQ